MSSKIAHGQTKLNQLHQSGSLKCLFPRQHGKGIQAVILNCAGGMTGGDSFELNIRAGSQTDVTLTSQTAERIYGAKSGQKGQISTTLHVEDKATLRWIPQETILFDQSALERILRVELERDTTFLFVESVVFGRLEMGETLHSVYFNDRIEVYRAGTPLYFDFVHLNGNLAKELDKPAIANGARTVTLLLFISPDAKVRLATLNKMLPTTAGASLLYSDTIILRMLTRDSYKMRKSLIPILQYLTNNELPKCWTL